METAESKILKATISIIEESIFFSTILLNMEVVVTTDIPTAAVDGTHVFFNPDYIKSLTSSLMIGLIMHELLHLAYDHIGRRGTRDPRIHNIACDIVIDTDLRNDGYEVPDSLANDKYDGWTSEKVYDVIAKNLPKKYVSIPLDLLEPKDPSAASQHVTEILTQAITAADIKGQGAGIPNAIRLHVEKLLNPILDWRVILQKHMQEYSKEDYSWRRANRRYLPDFYIPSQYSPSIKHLVAAFDSSGSVSKEETKMQLTEVQEIRNIYDLEKLTIYSVDTAIRARVEVAPEDSILDIEIKGGGGTHFHSIFSELAKNPPTVLIFFSDLEVSFDFPAPKFPVIWINTWDNTKVPKKYGQTIIMKPR